MKVGRATSREIQRTKIGVMLLAGSSLHGESTMKMVYSQPLTVSYASSGSCRVETQLSLS